MFSPRSYDNFGADLFNANRQRNARNTNRFDYNCGGYALGIFAWYLPSYSSDVWGCWEDWDDEEMQDITEEAIEVMLHDFTDLRLITALNEVRHDEYAIAFRISSDGDFHYIKQERSRMWTHKCGAGIIRTMTRWEVFNTHWDDRYDGPIVLFAKKKGLTKPLSCDTIMV